jgi:hypothetical protein
MEGQAEGVVASFFVVDKALHAFGAVEKQKGRDDSIAGVDGIDLHASGLLLALNSMN